MWRRTEWKEIASPKRATLLRTRGRKQFGMGEKKTWKRDFSSARVHHHQRSPWGRLCVVVGTAWIIGGIQGMKRAEVILHYFIRERAGEWNVGRNWQVQDGRRIINFTIIFLDFVKLNFVFLVFGIRRKKINSHFLRRVRSIHIKKSL